MPGPAGKPGIPVSIISCLTCSANWDAYELSQAEK